MKQTTLLFHGANADEVLKELASPDSGFEVDLRQPLESNYADAIAITGVIVSTVQLAVSLYQIHTAAKPPTPGAEIHMEVIRPDRTVIKMEGKNITDFEALIK